MPAALEPGEIEEIEELIRQDNTVKSIMEATGRSRSTIFKVAKDAGLSLITDSKARSGPYDEADRVTYARSKGFIRGETGRVYDDIMEVGTLAVQKYRKEAHAHNISVMEYLDQAVEFFKGEILMVETRKYVIEELERENKQLRASLSVMGIVKDMTMTLLAQGHDIDFDNLMVAARAISAAANEGAYVDEQRERSGIEPHGEEIGIDQGPAPRQGIEPPDTDTDDFIAGEPTPEEHLRGHERHNGPEDDGEPDEPGELEDTPDGPQGGRPPKEHGNEGTRKPDGQEAGAVGWADNGDGAAAGE